MKKVVTLTTAVYLVIVLVLLLVGCKTTAAEETTATAAEETTATAAEETTATAAEETTAAESIDMSYRFGHLIYDQSFTASQVIAEGIKKYADGVGIEIVTADITADAAMVPNMVATLINQDIDALIDGTWLAEPGATTVATCKELGIYHTSFDVVFDEEWSYTIGANNYEAGKLAGAAVAEIVKEKWDSAVDYAVGLNPLGVGSAGTDRIQGTIDGIKEAGVDFSDENYFEFDTEGQSIVAKNVTQDFLTAHPDSKKIVFIAIDDDYAIGSFAGAETSNRLDDCIIVACAAGNPQMLEHLATTEKGVLGTVNFGQSNWGKVAIDLVLKLLEDPDAATELEHSQYVPITFVDRENVSEYYKKQ